VQKNAEQRLMLCAASVLYAHCKDSLAHENADEFIMEAQQLFKRCMYSINK
jgi:hypothetical protein